MTAISHAQTGSSRSAFGRIATAAMQSTSIALGLAVLAAGAAEARITRIEITRVESPTFEGRAFGSVGQYEKLAGRAYGEVDPNDPRNAVIVDIANAPRNARGMVEYDTDIYILKPVDQRKGNRRLWFEINNRGNMPAYAYMNDARVENNDPTKASEAGNGFLMRQGYTILEAGWDAGADGRFRIRVPVAKNPDGSSITGPSMEEFVIDDDTTMIGDLTYPAATLDKTQASLTVRKHVDDPPVAIPPERWEYTDATGRAIRLLPRGTAFEQGTLYTFVYPAKDPIVAGLGFAAIRDVGSFFRNAEKDDAGNVNPLAGAIQYVYTGCQSQPCRFMHDFLWLGFNEDESGRRVADGVQNWTGGATGIFVNYRFSQGGRTHRQHIARWFPEFQMPFTYQVIHDPITGKTDGRLRRCLASDTCPKIIETNSANEFWSKNMAAGLVDAKGNDLADEPANVRQFFLASVHHAGAFSQGGRGICQQVRNPLTPNAVNRALLVALDEWVSKGVEPPASRIPRVSDGTLVPPLPQSAQGFPVIPGVRYNGRMHTGDLFDYGPKFDEGILTVLPPRLVGTPYPALVPKADADGNDIAGIRLPEVAVPLATFTGWALRANSEDGCDGAGQMIPFAKTKAEREAKGDPRLSIEERYPTKAAYVEAVRAAASALQRERLLLQEDVDAYVRRASEAPIGN